MTFIDIYAQHKMARWYVGDKNPNIENCEAT